MRQAADLVDGLLRRENWLDEHDALGGHGALGGLLRTPETRGSSLDAPETRGSSLDALEKRVQTLEAVVAKLLPRSDRGDRGSPSNGKTPPETRRVQQRVTLAPGCALSRGEEHILAALSQHGARTSDELCALVDYRATSIYTYLSNLRAVGYIVSEAGHHATTLPGDEHAAGHDPIPIGPALYQAWLGRPGLSAGEKVILERIAQAGPSGMRAGDLVGETTGLKGTSVYTYVSLLVRRKLLVRPLKGHVALAPILVQESSS